MLCRSAVARRVWLCLAAGACRLAGTSLGRIGSRRGRAAGRWMRIRAASRGWVRFCRRRHASAIGQTEAARQNLLMSGTEGSGRLEARQRHARTGTDAMARVDGNSGGEERGTTHKAPPEHWAGSERQVRLARTRRATGEVTPGDLSRGSGPAQGQLSFRRATAPGALLGRQRGPSGSSPELAHNGSVQFALPRASAGGCVGELCLGAKTYGQSRYARGGELVGVVLVRPVCCRII